MGSLSDHPFVNSGNIISQVSFYLFQQGDKDIYSLASCFHPPPSSSFSALENNSKRTYLLVKARCQLCRHQPGKAWDKFYLQTVTEYKLTAKYKSYLRTRMVRAVSYCTCIYKNTHAFMCAHMFVCMYRNILIFSGTLFPSYKPEHLRLKQIVASSLFTCQTSFAQKNCVICSIFGKHVNLQKKQSQF